MRGNMRWMLSGAVGLMLVLAACGGGGGGGTSPADQAPGTEGLTKAEFIRQADAICDSTNQQARAALSALEEESPEAFAALVETLTSIWQQMHDDLQALGAPPEDAQAVGDFLAAFQAAIDLVRDQGGAAFEAKPGPLDEAMRLAADYGFTTCADIYAG